MEKPALFLSLPFILIAAVNAQTPQSDSTWLETKSLRVCLQADGSLYSGAPGGAVQYRQETPNGDKWVTIVKDAGLWFKGADPLGNLLVSVHQFENQKPGFLPGIEGVPGSGKMWRVTQDEILAHIEDFSDNGVIDNPIPSIFAWPGEGSRFMESKNGFALPGLPQYVYADFFDYNYNGIYDPDKGDYPNASIRGSGSFQTADLIFFMFQTVDNPQHSFHRFPVQGWGHAFTLACTDVPVLDNTVFLIYNWQNTGKEAFSEAVAGFYMNPDLGYPNDDYQGCLPDNNIYFTYNGDSLDESGFGLHPPVFALKALQSPLDTFGNEGFMRFMPVGEPYGSNGTMPAGQSFPESPYEFYNYLNCSWRDGSPLTQGGTGYNESAVRSYTAFPGNPFVAGNWTEYNAQNPPGDRRALINWDYGGMPVNYINRMVLMLTVMPQDDALSDNIANFDRIRLEMAPVADWLGCCSPVPIPDCITPPQYDFNRYIVRTYPQPVSDLLHVQIEGKRPQSLRLYDCLGHVAQEYRFGPDEFFLDKPLDLPVRNLPSGIYFLKANSWNSIETAIEKVLILH